MNFYHFIFRLDTDDKKSKRSFEGYFEHEQSAMSALVDYARMLNTSLVNEVIILHKSVYLSVFR